VKCLIIINFVTINFFWPSSVLMSSDKRYNSSRNIDDSLTCFLRNIIWAVMIFCCLRKIKLYSKYNDFRKYNQIFSNKSGFDGHDRVKLRQFLSHFDTRFHFATSKYVFGSFRGTIDMSANITKYRPNRELCCKIYLTQIVLCPKKHLKSIVI